MQLKHPLLLSQALIEALVFGSATSSNKFVKQMHHRFHF
jgi:hypothetical protein